MADLPDRPRKIIHIDMDAFYASVERAAETGTSAIQPGLHPWPGDLGP